MPHSEDDYLQLSGIQHYAFCPRQWALIHIENRWAENWRTISGTHMHKRTHDLSQIEKRGDLIIMRALKVVSHTLGVSGECDVVEFRGDSSGVELHGYTGKYLPFPVEYKRGKPKYLNCDALQLTAQAICLEEMLLCHIPCGALFYGEPHRRHDVKFTGELRNQVLTLTQEMHKLAARGYTPRAKPGTFCKECSLQHECVPAIAKAPSARLYIQEHSQEEGFMK